MLTAVAVLMLQAAVVDSALRAYHDRTRAGPHCDAAVTGGDVVVCGRRAADRYRVPLVEPTAGDPAHEAVGAERDRLFARTSNCREKSLFQVGCGMAGVTAKTTFGAGGSSGPQMRPLAQ